MGAMHNDLNRCSFMYDEARRCRNPQETPGAALCYYHARKKEKEERREDSRVKELGAQALFVWLASHPLDTATEINHAVNQLCLSVAGNLISARRADSILRMMRLQLRTVPDVRQEHNAIIRDTHMQTKERFQKEIGFLLAVAAAQNAGDTDSGVGAEPEGPPDPPPAKPAKAPAVAAAA